MVATPRALTYGAAVHFGRQVKKERLAKHWSLEELSRQTGIDLGHLSRIERGLRPPTEKIAVEMDKAFTNREDWFTEYYNDSLVGIPPGLRNWAEHEDGERTDHRGPPRRLRRVHPGRHGLHRTGPRGQL
jgi:transcriptional regulator with XRE-family HTH domain